MLSKKGKGREAMFAIRSNDSILPWIAAIALNVSILIYISNVEQATCKCVNDWRQKFIKYCALFTIGALFFARVRMTLPKIAMIVLFIVQIINVFALFSFVGDLNKMKCSCAVKDQAKLHTFLNTWRYVPMFFVLCTGTTLVLTYLRST